MGDVQSGAMLLNEHHQPCRVVSATKPMYGHDVYAVRFDDGSVIKADADHLWPTVAWADRRLTPESAAQLRTTLEIKNSLRTTGQRHHLNHAIRLHKTPKTKWRLIVSVTAISSEPVKCIGVDSPSHLYLAGKSMIPTHNTFSLLLEPLRHVRNPKFNTVILRRTYRDIMKIGSLWDESQSLYPQFGGVSRENVLDWKFHPSGARVAFSGLQYDTDLEDWKGAQINLLCFDQLETFTEKMWWYMFSRNRSMSGIPPYVRATCNPSPDSWLSRLLTWWIDQDTGYAIEERSGVVRWFARVSDVVHWSDTHAELAARFAHIPDVQIKSFTFIRASVFDNKALLAKDPAYVANLNALTYVDKERLLHGNWKVKEEAGKVFNRHHFKIVDAAPAGGQECRFFDLAATEKQVGKKDPDFTASILTRKVDGKYYILDMTAEQLDAGDVDPHMENIVAADVPNAKASGSRYTLRWEVEGGSAGKREARRMTAKWGGLDAQGVAPQGDKLVRAKPVAVQAQAGNVYLVAGPWNESLLAHLHNQPELPHDDIMDALSGSFAALNDQFSTLYDYYKKRAAAQAQPKDGADDGEAKEKTNPALAMMAARKKKDG